MLKPTPIQILALGPAIAALLMGCASDSLSERLTKYRNEIESVLRAEPVEGDPAAAPRLPRRRLRRVDVDENRIGVFDFLDVIGCELSEVVAARNSGLGRVLEPTRRLAHETAVIDAIYTCLPTLRAERADRLRVMAEEKEGQLPHYRWNAIWLDREVERFLSDGPPAFLGGVDATDGPEQLARVARVMAEPGVRLPSAQTLEAAFRELRDDAGVGSVIRTVDRARRELSRVATVVAETSIDSCDRETRRLVRTFESHYLPIQFRLVEVDRKAFSVLEALDLLYRESAEGVPVPPAMRQFGTGALDTVSDNGLWQRYRAAVVGHAAAWQSALSACGVIDT